MFTVELPDSPEAVSQARRFIHERFGDLLTRDAEVDAQIAVSELVTNAIVHGRGAVSLRAGVRDDALRIEVVDQGTGNAPAIREQSEADTGGWGLRIVDTVSLRWGAFEGTTHVWADLSTR